MGKVKLELARTRLPDREAHNSRMFIDLCENIHIHHREFRVVFSLNEYFEFSDILARSTEDVRSYLAQNPDYAEGVFPTTLMVAGGQQQQRKLLANSPQPNKSAYFANDFAIELQDESVVDEIHVHWRDYRFAMPRDHFKQVAETFAQAKSELQKFENSNSYRRSDHRDRTMDGFAAEATKYTAHQPAIMGQSGVALSAILSRFDPGQVDEAFAGSWHVDPSELAALKSRYMGGEDVAPVILSTERDGRHLVIDGNHRLLAARQLGLKTLNCIVTDLTFAASADFRQAEGLLKRFDQQTGFRFNTSGFTRQFFAYRASRYYSDHFHRHTWRRHLLTRYRWARALAAVLRWGRRLATSVARGLGVVPRA